MKMKVPPEPREIAGVRESIRIPLYFRSTGDHYAVQLAAFNANRSMTSWILEKILPLAEAENVANAQKKRLKFPKSDRQASGRRG